MKTIYQILIKGTFTKELKLINVENRDTFRVIIKAFKRGEYENLLLVDTNIYEKY